MHKDQIKAENEKNGNTNRKDTHTHTKNLMILKHQRC